MFLVFLFCRDKLQPQSKVSLRDLQSKSNCKAAAVSSSAPAPTPGHSEQPDALLLSNLSLTVADKGTLSAADHYNNISLADVTVPLEAIKPSEHKHQLHNKV